MAWHLDLYPFYPLRFSNTARERRHDELVHYEQNFSKTGLDPLVLPAAALSTGFYHENEDEDENLLLNIYL